MRVRRWRCGLQAVVRLEFAIARCVSGAVRRWEHADDRAALCCAIQTAANMIRVACNATINQAFVRAQVTTGNQWGGLPTISWADISADAVTANTGLDVGYC
jgi:hypothetical protein